MKRYVLVMIWPDGEEMTLTEPTTRRRKLAHVPDWIKDGAQVYSVTGWRAGQPFTISNAAAEVVTLTTPDGFKFRADIVEVLTEFSRTA